MNRFMKHCQHLPEDVIGKVIKISAAHGVDLNTVAELDNGTYYVGEPRTGLVIWVTPFGAYFQSCGKESTNIDPRS